MKVYILFAESVGNYDDPGKGFINVFTTPEAAMAAVHKKGKWTGPWSNHDGRLEWTQAFRNGKYGYPTAYSVEEWEVSDALPIS